MNDLLIRGIEINWNLVDDESYVRDIPSIRDIDLYTFKNNVTFFTGENGSGKSTLLEAIAVSYGFNPEGGTMNYRFSTRDTHSDLSRATRIIKSTRRPFYSYFLRAESFYNVATAEENYGRDSYSGSKGYHRKSHGESFLALAQDQFNENGIFLLDEPEAALSPQRQLTLLLEMDRSVREGSQFIIATHSPILLAFPGAEILSFDDGKIHPVSYEDTESYRITEMFINDRDLMMRNLFKNISIED